MPRRNLDTKGFKDYDRIRRYLERIYLYGCYSSEDFARMNQGSADDYNYVMGLMKDLFWREDEKRDGEFRDGKRYPSIARQYAFSGQNRMADSYMLYSMKNTAELWEYLRIMQSIAQRGKRISQLGAELELLPDARKASYLNAKNHVQEMLELGYVENPEKHIYKLGKDSFTDRQIGELYDYVCFAASVTHPRVPGSFLRRTLEREMIRRGRTVPNRSPFVLRHNSSHNIFDEEIVFQLLDVIRNRRWIQVGGQEYLPVELRPESRFGRWYVLAVNRYQEKLSPSILQLSRIKRLTVSGQAEESLWQEAAEVVAKAYENSLYSGTNPGNPVLVEAKLHFGAQKGLENQFSREILMGSVEQKEDGAYYRAMVNDPVELLPLLRAYAPWVEVLPGEHDLDRRLRQSLEEMAILQEGGNWEPVSQKVRKQAEEPETGDKTDLKLFNRFQSRAMQFCLDVFAWLERGEPLNPRIIAGLEAKYGIPNSTDLLLQLKRAEFIDRETGCLSSDYANPPRLPMSQVEREYLQYILDERQMPEVSLFLSEETRKALTTQPPQWKFYIHQHRPKGMELPRNPGPEGFRVLLEAIHGNLLVRYRYRTRDSREEQEALCVPWKLEYSAYDRRWWAILYDPEQKRTVKAPLNHLRDMSIAGKSGVTEPEIEAAMDTLRMPEPVVIRVKDERNALQRCFLAFENQEIFDSSRIGPGEYRLCFHAYRFDEEEILRQLMQLGSNVALEAPTDLKERLRQRVKESLECNQEKEPEGVL